MWWEPTDAAAFGIRLIIQMEDILYYMLLVSGPVIGALLLIISTYILNFGRTAKMRKAAFKKLSRSMSRGKRLTKAERDAMANDAVRVVGMLNHMFSMMF